MSLNDLPQETVSTKSIVSKKRAAEPLVDATTTGEILSVLAMADDGRVAVTHDELAALGAKLAAKVDGNKYVQTEIAAKLKEFGALKKRVDATIKALKGQAERQKQYLAFHMYQQELETIPGVLWKVRLTHDQKVKPKREPAAIDAELYPNFVKVTYTWSKEALAAALEANDPLAFEVAEFEETQSVKFETYKGALLDAK